MLAWTHASLAKSTLYLHAFIQHIINEYHLWAFLTLSTRSDMVWQPPAYPTSHHIPQGNHLYHILSHIFSIPTPWLLCKSHTAFLHGRECAELLPRAYALHVLFPLHGITPPSSFPLPHKLIFDFLPNYPSLNLTPESLISISALVKW